MDAGFVIGDIFPCEKAVHVLFGDGLLGFGLGRDEVSVNRTYVGYDRCVLLGRLRYLRSWRWPSFVVNLTDLYHFHLTARTIEANHRFGRYDLLRGILTARLQGLGL